MQTAGSAKTGDGLELGGLKTASRHPFRDNIEA